MLVTQRTLYLSSGLQLGRTDSQRIIYLHARAYIHDDRSAAFFFFKFDSCTVVFIQASKERDPTGQAMGF